MSLFLGFKIAIMPSHVRFRGKTDRLEAGTAIVFSSSFLHEAMHVTPGRRFVFLAFLFGEH
jgi:predicted 2-oxoglutarate/Fe(II)-dependent dioxygenase YbiX